MSRLPLFRLPLFRLLGAIAVTLLALAERGWAQSTLFDFQIRSVSELEIADGAPAGAVLDLFVTTDRDMHAVYVTDSIPNTFYQHEIGTDKSNPPAALTNLYPALGADSWFTSPGSTSIAGDGFNEHPGTGRSLPSAWFDFTDDGSVTDFQFGRLTVPTGITTSLRGEILLRGGGKYPYSFELEVDAAGEVSWETFDPILPETLQPRPDLSTTEPTKPDPTPVVVTPSPEPTEQSKEPVVVEQPIREIDPGPAPDRELIDIVLIDEKDYAVDPLILQPVNWGQIVAIDVARSSELFLIDTTDTITWDVDSGRLASLGTHAYTTVAYDGAPSLNVVAATSGNAVIPEPSSIVLALLCVASSLLIRPSQPTITQPI